ncbi:glycosyltransferase family protein [Paenibacillus campi]|uniref:glycosyltransferase family protein n=1 Tax=Paenibacillus campi TaxID=3106031 RepID=UPI002AFF3801|nr:glycosyltransferase family protein [Paenibacillus sp. SGZ-1009]
MKIIVIIQARMGSTRLPGKVLMPLGDSCILDYVVQRCRKIQLVDHVIVATSTLEQDNPLAAWCEANKVTCYRGSEDDVLARYYECAHEYQPDYVIRVTSDCPFVDYELANETIQLMVKQPADIIINQQQEQLTRGLTTELFSFAALQWMYEHTTAERHREHVTYYAYEYSEHFNYSVLDVPSKLLHPELRLTVDTPEDYEVCRLVASELEHSIDRSAQEIVDYLLTRPDIYHINAHIQQKPVV